MCSQVCWKTLNDNRALMEKLVDELVETETVDAAAFQKMVLEHTSSEEYIRGLQTA